MTSLDQAPGQLAATLDAALPRTTVKYPLPMQLNSARAVVIQPGDEYLTRTEDHGDEWVAQFDALATVRVVADPAAMTSALNVLIRDLIAALPGEWDLEQVGAPDLIKFGEWLRYGVPFTVSTIVTL